ncbi:uncharacterized protein LOC133329253 [Musca vetustissima]|uniref:uncharacterized protein LOC133329253 n=1 Tax=Musca vetustissima TaxID=27455 RepID=UPI002AB6176C|nr:uncharacterized protein LOC133329253 [Musca vetustissima]
MLFYCQALILGIENEIYIIGKLCRSYVGINEEIMWVSIGMGITIALLITIALCYIAREKCQKRQREYYVSA